MSRAWFGEREGRALWSGHWGSSRAKVEGKEMIRTD